VSDNLQGLVEEGYVNKYGRGRYEIIKECVDWLISQTDGIRDYVKHVSKDVIGQDGETVSLTMDDGVLRARVGDAGGATAVEVTDADAGRDVGITNLEGVVDYELGMVTIVSIPRVQQGGSAVLDPVRLSERAETHDLLAVAGTEALAVATAAGHDADIRSGSVAAVLEAGSKGLDVFLCAAADTLSAHTDRLRQQNVGYEVVDAEDV